MCPQFCGRKWLRQFYGRLECLCSFCRRTSMSIKFLVSRGGSADFILMGAGISQVAAFFFGQFLVACSRFYSPVGRHCHFVGYFFAHHPSQQGEQGPPAGLVANKPSKRFGFCIQLQSRPLCLLLVQCSRSTHLSDLTLRPPIAF